MSVHRVHPSYGVGRTAPRSCTFPMVQLRTPSIIYYKVDNIQASFETLKERGVTFTDEPHMIAKMPDHELWMAFFKDVDDNVLAIMCEVRD